MMRGWTLQLGILLTVGGLVALSASMWPAPAEDGVATATHDAGAQPSPEGEDAQPTAWRDAVRVAGGIILVAGAGLLLLAVLPGRAERD